MWTADHWKDYEILDTSGGEKLERWGKYLLVRPDPQVIWDTPREHMGLEEEECPLSPQLQGRRRMGVFRPASAVGDPLPGSDISAEALQF